ncbi:glycosyltransferase family 4 protein [Proteus mirabilis]|uniref:glycosyltransferase family 4 protein n=1 Tax=Proteus mirabilis TaxID=584 RepID=UPI001D078428|nr:glycosyltransferase family 4 protein [Proteus mirabilis]MCB6148618.1 glycosyltransferase family 4 protein [Proteus mirabilis]MCT0102334.1 glycosyltransferase family 4 protein [Proteus mirabilis]HCT9396536.1 glycosyltransferase family 4 protein [Proteus mirabilis]HEJ0338334.1 glycosyltransferase family 4 protein [Proteus mirabilis]HEO9726780.1 glycosyltransferase family 4 protein [Proteus mirabilis]
MSKSVLSILHTESSCGWGGQEIRILTESQGMVQRGHHVTLVCCPNSKIAKAAPDYGIEVVTLPIEKKRGSALMVLRNWLKVHRQQFDVINTHSSTDAWLVALSCASLRHSPAIVRTRHVSTDVSRSLPTRWLYLSSSAHIVTTGEKLRQTLHQYNRFPLSQMTSVPTGIDLEKFSPQNKQQAREKIGVPNKPTLGIVATMRVWKGHKYLIEAWKTLHLQFPDWQLLLVGDGPQRKNLQPMVKLAGLEESVFFLGNRNDVPDCLNAMDLFALPSFGNEGVPQGIMQAMACGLPVVSTTVGAISEAVIDGKTGFTLAPQVQETLINYLAKLMASDELRQQMGQASLAHAKAQFGLDNMLDKMEKIFINAISLKDKSR